MPCCARPTRCTTQPPLQFSLYLQLVADCLLGVSHREAGVMRVSRPLVRHQTFIIIDELEGSKLLVSAIAAPGSQPMSGPNGCRGTLDSPARDLKPDRTSDTKSNASRARMRERGGKWLSFTVHNYETSQLASGHNKLPTRYFVSSSFPFKMLSRVSRRFLIKYPHSNRSP